MATKNRGHVTPRMPHNTQCNCKNDEWLHLELLPFFVPFPHLPVVIFNVLFQCVLWGSQSFIQGCYYQLRKKTWPHPLQEVEHVRI